MRGTDGSISIAVIAIRAIWNDVYTPRREAMNKKTERARSHVAFFLPL